MTLAPFDFQAAFTVAFSKCTKCENRVPGEPALCPECEGVTQGKFDGFCEAERAAIETIPAAFRWADPSAPAWKAGSNGKVTTEKEVLEIAHLRRVLFYGGPGAGKTTLAAACLRRWARGGRRGMFLAASELAVARLQHPAGRGEAPTVIAALATELLVLDDLGLDIVIPTSAIAEVIHARHAHNRRTWVTTGLSSKALTERYGAHILRRLWEGAKLVDLRPKTPAAGPPPPNQGEAKP